MVSAAPSRPERQAPGTRRAVERTEIAARTIMILTVLDVGALAVQGPSAGAAWDGRDGVTV